MGRSSLFEVCVILLHSIFGFSALICPVDKTGIVINLFEGRSAFALECPKHFGPNAIYSWNRLTPNFEARPRNNHMQANGTSLFFLDFTVAEEGDYTCLVKVSQNEQERMGRFVRLRKTRIEPFSNKHELTTIPVIEFSYLRVPCSFKGAVVGDDINYNWNAFDNDSKKQVSHGHERMYTDLSGALHFTSVLKIDEIGNHGPIKYYSLVSSNKLSLGRFGDDVQLKVQALAVPPLSRPVLKHKSGSVTVAVTKVAQLECVFSGYHPTTDISYRWYLHDGSQITTDSKKYMLLFNNRRLKIANVEESDDGEYYCEAENGAGISTREVNRLSVTCD